MPQWYTSWWGPRRPLQHRCSFCDATRPKLLRCAGCRLVRYCSREHQKRDWWVHRSICRITCQHRTKLGIEENAVRHATPDYKTPANAFETHVGIFGATESTRDYMEARRELGNVTRRACTLDSVTETLEHYQDMIRLCHADSMFVSNHVPDLMLRIDRDQECYDFIKWWDQIQLDIEYDWSDMEASFQNIKNADVMEDPEYMIRDNWSDVGFCASVLLLKFKMLIDIRNIKVVRKVVAGQLPVELGREVEKHAVRSPLSLQFVDLPYNDLSQAEHVLLDDCEKLGWGIVKSNRLFMSELAYLQERETGCPGGGHPCEAHETVARQIIKVYSAWRETEGALELLRAAFIRAQDDNPDAVVGYPGYAGRQPALIEKEPGATSTDEEFTRLWNYLKLIVIDSSYLGPPDNKPSQRRSEKELSVEDNDVKLAKRFEDQTLSQ
ncbi:MYND-type zinc finger protein samB [Apiospora arundinis]|uniref:MYND-type zinc finger protein samB n=1 Tax=Apiospora arundinis TaxID=335852 RepID=A0ABR2HYF1_9PEZI